jgi:hypothetical protein
MDFGTSMILSEDGESLNVKNGVIGFCGECAVTLTSIDPIIS